MDSWFEWRNEDLLLRLRVQPKSSKDGFVEPYGDAFKVRITAPPVDGKANKHLQRFLSKAFGVPLRQVSIESGAHSRDKLMRIINPASFPPELQSVADRSNIND